MRAAAAPLTAVLSPQHDPGGGEGSARGAREDGVQATGHSVLGLRRVRRSSAQGSSGPHPSRIPPLTSGLWGGQGPGGEAIPAGGSKRDLSLQQRWFPVCSCWGARGAWIGFICCDFKMLFWSPTLPPAAPPLPQPQTRQLPGEAFPLWAQGPLSLAHVQSWLRQERAEPGPVLSGLLHFRGGHPAQPPLSGWVGLGPLSGSLRLAGVWVRELRQHPWASPAHSPHT